MELEPRESERGSYAARQIITDLFKGRLTPAGAASSFEKLFKRQGLAPEEAYERIRMQHGVFQDGNFPTLTQTQGVDWDSTVIILESVYDIPEDQRSSNNRLIPVGTPSIRPDFEDLAF